MDEHTLKVLEFDRIREAASHHAACSLGLEHIRALMPSTDIRVVRERLAETTECRTLLDSGDRLPFGGLSDCRALVKQAKSGGRLLPEELLEVCNSLEALRRLRDSLSSQQEKYPRLASVAAAMSSFAALERQIQRCIGERGEVRDSASPSLGQIRSSIRTAQGRLNSRLEAVLRNPAYRLMIQDAVLVQRSGRTCIPIKLDFRGQFPGLVHDQSASGQTVFMEPTEALETANEVRRLELEEQEEIDRILLDLSAAIGAEAESIERSLHGAGVLDFIYARASYSRDTNSSSPALESSARILLRTARHPLLGADVVPLDIEMDDGRRTVVITGPNTGGKTVALKTVGLLALMSQAGLHIPAAPGSRLPVFPAIFADIGDEQSIAQSLSTFSSHLRQITRIVNHLEPGALVLLDELGAGTDPVEGSALASTLLEHLTEADARTIVTTHYGELKELAYRTPGVENASVQFDEETLRPTYRLQMGVPGRSLALVIAARLGLPAELVEKATSRVRHEELSAWEMLRQLEHEKQLTSEARHRAEEEAREAARLRDRRQKELSDLERRRKEILAKAVSDAQGAVQETREQVKQILADLRQRAERGAADRTVPTHQATEALAAMDKDLTEVRKKIDQSTRTAAPPMALVPGLSVSVPGFAQRGTVLEVGADHEATVAIGNLKVRVPAAELMPAAPDPPRPVRDPTQGLKNQKAADMPSELKLLGLRSEEAVERLDKYLDDAMLSGVPAVRVIHGKGTGALKNAVWQWLRGHPAVQSYRIGQDGEGGSGATVVEIAHD